MTLLQYSVEHWVPAVVSCPEQYRACDGVTRLGEKDQSVLLATVVTVLETTGASKKWPCASLRVR